MKKIISLVLLISMSLITTSSYATSFVMHTAKQGDSYWNLSEQYNVSVNELESLNDDSIYAGSLVKIMPVSMNRTITIKIDNQIIETDQNPYIENDRTFVPIRFIAKALNVDEIMWDDQNKTAILKNDTKTIKLTLGSDIAKVNEKDVKLDAPVNVYQGRTYIPVRFISEIFDCEVSWDHNSYSVVIDTKNIDDEDLYWLSRIIHAEAGAESFEGKLAVGNVIINRKNSADFPNTIKGVIFDTNYGYQYTPAKNGTIYNTPSEESIEAAKSALSGNNNIADCQYFLNPRKSTNNWIIKNKTFYKSIGLHDFYG